MGWLRKANFGFRKSRGEGTRGDPQNPSTYDPVNSATPRRESTRVSPPLPRAPLWESADTSRRTPNPTKAHPKNPPPKTVVGNSGPGIEFPPTSALAYDTALVPRPLLK